MLALAFGDDHLNDLPPPSDQFGQQPSLLIRDRTHRWLHRLDEPRDHRGINRVRLGTLTNRLREMPDLGRVDQHQRELGSRPLPQRPI